MIKILFNFSFVFVNFFSFASASECTLEAKVEGAIGAGTLDYIERAGVRAKDKKCESILLLINTPGGSLQSTRMIVEEILNSDLPFLCLVHPAGAHAGSAGAIILQACHVAGAIEATNIGAATPVLGTGKEMPEDLRKKMINDTVSWLEGLVKLRGRNKKFSEEIVTEAKAVSAEEALKLGAIDIVTKTVDEFLEKSEQRKVKISEGKEIEVRVGARVFYEPDLRSRILEMVGDPQFAYLIFMGSLALLYFELTHPGTLVPGVVGALGLVVSLITFHKLDVQWGGLALLLLGLVFMIAEAFVPSFGVLGIGGVISFVLGSLFLFDQEATGYSIPLTTILPTAIGLGLFTFFLAYLMFKTRSLRVHTGKNEIIGQLTKITSLDSGSTKTGKLHCFGELWKFESDTDVQVGDQVEVKDIDHMILKVIKKES